MENRGNERGDFGCGDQAIYIWELEHAQGFIERYNENLKERR